MNVIIPGQSSEERARMVDMLRMYGFMGLQEYSRIIDVLRDLPQLYVDSDLRFFLDAQDFQFFSKSMG